MSSIRRRMAKTIVLVVAILLPAERMLPAACCGMTTPDASGCAALQTIDANGSVIAGQCCCHARNAAADTQRCHGECRCSCLPQAMEPTIVELTVTYEPAVVAIPLLPADATAFAASAQDDLRSVGRAVLLPILYCRLLR